MVLATQGRILYAVVNRQMNLFQDNKNPWAKLQLSWGRKSLLAKYLTNFAIDYHLRHQTALLMHVPCYQVLDLQSTNVMTDQVEPQASDQAEDNPDIFRML
jgi:hypothetical protein